MFSVVVVYFRCKISFNIIKTAQALFFLLRSLRVIPFLFGVISEVVCDKEDEEYL